MLACCCCAQNCILLPAPPPKYMLPRHFKVSPVFGRFLSLPFAQSGPLLLAVQNRVPSLRPASVNKHYQVRISPIRLGKLPTLADNPARCRLSARTMELRSRTIGRADDASTEPRTPTSTTTAHETAFTSEGSPITPSRKLRSAKVTRRRKYSIARQIAAWLVHLYTATGLLVNMYSLLALFRKPDFSLFAKLNWLAILIDATDGTLARAVDIKNVVPTYDGAMLDNIIDFQTFAVLPALAVIVFEIVPGVVAQYVAAGSILLASAYQFCQTVAKTSDAFVGFPSFWNIVVFYVYYLHPSPFVTLAIIFSCAIISFTPIHFIYPTRTKACHVMNHAGAYVWATLMLVPTFLPNSPYSKPALIASFVYVAYYVVFSVVLDMRRRKEEG